MMKIGGSSGDFLPGYPHSAETYYFWEKAGVLIASCALTGAVMAGIIEKTEPDPCPAPSEETIRTVTKLFDTPKPAFHGPVEPGSYTNLDWQQEQEDKKTRELGIIFPSVNTDTKDSLNAALYPEEYHVGPKPFTEYLAFARDVLGQSNIPIILGVPEEMRSDDGVAAQDPTAEELESDASKRQVMELVELFEDAPVNLTANIGVTKVALTAHGTATSREVFSYAGLALTDDGVLIIDLANDGQGEDDSGPHELYHLVDADGCNGNIGNDPGYAALNRVATYAEGWPLPDGFMDGQPKPFSAVSDALYTLHSDQYRAGRQNNVSVYCYYEKRLRELQAPIEMMEDYSHYNIKEDKATLGEHIFDPYNYPNFLNAGLLVIRQKMLFLLARLYEKHPTVVRYYAIIANRPTASVFSCR